MSTPPLLPALALALLAGCGARTTLESSEEHAPLCSAKDAPSVGPGTRTHVLAEFDRAVAGITAVASAVDACGAIYISGRTSVAGKVGGIPVAANHAFVARFDANETVDWAVSLPDESTTGGGFSAAGIAVGPSGSVFVFGPLSGRFEIEGKPSLVSSSGSSILVVRLDSAGDVSAASQFESEFNWALRGAVATDEGGLMMVATGSGSIKVGDTSVRPSSPGSSSFLARLDENLVPRSVTAFTNTEASGVSFLGLSEDSSRAFHVPAQVQDFDFGHGPLGQDVTGAALTFDADGTVTAVEPYQGAIPFAVIGTGTGRTFSFGHTLPGAVLAGKREPANRGFVAGDLDGAPAFAEVVQQAELVSLVVSKGEPILAGRTTHAGAKLGGQPLGLGASVSFTALLDVDGKVQRTHEAAGPSVSVFPNGDLVDVEVDVEVGAATRILATRFAP